MVISPGQKTISEVPFDLCAGHPALDFVNSLDNRFNDRGRIERLQNRAFKRDAKRLIWRRERDSNPRRAFDPYTLSRGAPSTTRPSLRPGENACGPGGYEDGPALPRRRAAIILQPHEQCSARPWASPLRGRRCARLSKSPRAILGLSTASARRSRCCCRDHSRGSSLVPSRCHYRGASAASNTG
jgi:hypothetical protein